MFSQAGRDPPGYRDSEIFKACQKGMESLRLQMREARQAGEQRLCMWCLQMQNGQSRSS